MKRLLLEAWWILRNDLRLMWADVLAARRRAAFRAGVVLALFAAVSLLSILIFSVTRYAPSPEIEGLAWIFFGTVMLGAGVHQAIKVLFERADFDLLLSAPISAQAVVLARLSTLVVGALASAAFFVMPALAGAVVGTSGCFAYGYAVWLALAIIAAAAALWIAVLAVRTIGPRRARVILQIVGAAAGGGIYLVTQTHLLLTAAQQQTLGRFVSAAVRHPPVSWCVAGSHGEGHALATLLGIAAALLAATAALLGRLFVAGVQESTVAIGRRQRHIGTYAFARGAVYVTFRKDLRLIARDPLLLGRLVPAIIYWIPLLFVFIKTNLAAGLAAFALMLATQFSMELCEVAVAGEECADLIAMSPTSEMRLRLAKLAAGAALPLAGAGAICVALVFVGHPWLALTTLAFSTLAASAASWLEVAEVQPSPRRDLVARRHTHWNVRRVVGVAIMLLGTTGLGSLGAGLFALGTALLGAVVLAAIGCFTLVEMKPISAAAHA